MMIHNLRLNWLDFRKNRLIDILLKYEYEIEQLILDEKANYRFKQLNQLPGVQIQLLVLLTD